MKLCLLNGNNDAYKIGEVNMPKSSLAGIVVALFVAIPLGLTDAAAAVKKAKQVNFEQAWARCKTEVDKLPRDAHSARYTRGAACMKKLGHRI